MEFVLLYDRFKTVSIHRLQRQVLN